MTKTRLICLLALPRTGSSFICDLMAAHPQIESHSELFHRKAVFLGVPERPRLIRVFSQLLDVQLADYRDSRLVDFAHAKPLKFLDSLTSESVKPYILFKVFPRHLPWETLANSLLENTEILKLFLVRDPLQTYISFLLGRSSEQWSHQDTSSMLVKVDVDEFLEFSDRNREWQHKCEAVLQDTEQPYSTIQYESLRSLGSNLAVMDELRSALESLGVFLSPVTADVARAAEVRPIQNRRTDIRESISNFTEFLHQLEQRGRMDLVARHLD